jgi:hypothetical protein
MRRLHTTLYKNYQELKLTIQVKEFPWVGHEINLKIKNRLNIFVTVSPILDMSFYDTQKSKVTHAFQDTT